MTSIAVHDPKSGVADAASDAEEAVLSAVLIENAALDVASAIITSRDFGDRKRQRIFDAMLRLRSAGAAADPVTLADDMERHDQLKAAGGHEYIGVLLYAVPHADNVADHARLVLEHAKRRRLAQLGTDLAREATSGQMAAGDIHAAFAELLEATSRVA